MKLQITLALINLTLLHNQLFISLKDIPEDKRKKRLQTIEELKQAQFVISQQEKDIEWYKYNLRELNNLRLEIWERNREVAKLKKSIEKLTENIQL